VATEFNQLTASFSASCRIVSLPSNLVCRQESTHGLVWGSPHEQFGDCVSPHLYNEALQGSWPVWKRFNKDHEQRGRSKPGWRVVESTTMAWLVTEADCQFSFHCVVMSTGDKSDQMGCRDESRGGMWLKTSAWTGQCWWLFILDNILSTADFWCEFGGGMLVNIGSYWVGVGRRHHNISRMILCHWQSITWLPKIILAVNVTVSRNKWPF